MDKLIFIFISIMTLTPYLNTETIYNSHKINTLINIFNVNTYNNNRKILNVLTNNQNLRTDYYKKT
jgi:hypothetical protein